MLGPPLPLPPPPALPCPGIQTVIVSGRLICPLPVGSHRVNQSTGRALPTGTGHKGLMTPEIYLTIETPIKELLFYFISQPYGDALSSDAIKYGGV